MGVIGSLIAYFSFRFYKYVLKPILIFNQELKLIVDDKGNHILELNSQEGTLEDSLTKVLDQLNKLLGKEHSEILLYHQSKYAELQSQINPHFLYNTLESIRGQALIDDNFKIAYMTEALGKYFRYNIDQDQDKVMVADEIKNIQNYVHIQQYRFEDKIKFQIYAHDETGEYLKCIIPKMTLQPIVENAIFHGIERKIHGGSIHLHIETTEERLIILVTDDGMGMNEKTLHKMNQQLNNPTSIISYEKDSARNGIALENVNKRIKILFGKDYGIRVSSTYMIGTEVEVVIPKKLSV